MFLVTNIIQFDFFNGSIQFLSSSLTTSFLRMMRWTKIYVIDGLDIVAEYPLDKKEGHVRKTRSNRKRNHAVNAVPKKILPFAANGILFDCNIKDGKSDMHDDAMNSGFPDDLEFDEIYSPCEDLTPLQDSINHN